MPGRIPDRWEVYKPMGKQIKGTRFFAFKVPLSENMCRSMAAEDQFTPSRLLELVRDQGNTLGLVVDLTNTTRYYNPQVIQQSGVEYDKIFTEGHIVPGKAVRTKFFKALDNFLKENPENDKLVGVHCTHGLNRTGYMLCRYMIDRLKMAPDDAIKAFNEARGYDIERENYLQDLKTGKCHESNDYKEPSQARMDTWQNAAARNRNNALSNERLAPKRGRAAPYSRPDKAWRNYNQRPAHNADRHGDNSDFNHHFEGYDSYHSGPAHHSYNEYSHSYGGYGNSYDGYGASEWRRPDKGYGQFGRRDYWDSQPQRNHRNRSNYDERKRPNHSRNYNR